MDAPGGGGPRAGADVKITHAAHVAEVATGVEKKINLKVLDPCDHRRLGEDRRLDGVGDRRPADFGQRLLLVLRLVDIEMVTKVLGACGINGNYWVFSAGLTNVKVTLTVLDTSNGISEQYVNPLGSAFAPLQDTSAFATCP